MRFYQSIKFIWNHPLVETEKLMGLYRYFSFHILTRINNVERSIPFIENTKLSIQRDLSGVSTNYFTYLADFEEMLFLLHFLKTDDVFYDIGSNCGTYTILASGVVGCRTVAVEPVKETYNQLLKNLDLNQLGQKVITCNFAIGKDQGIINISNEKGALNRIVSNKQVNTEIVTQKSLDSISKEKPNLLKIDVEGYEMEVIKGGQKILSSPELQGIIIELNGNSRQYGITENQIHHEIIKYGFSPVRYDPFSRNISRIHNYNNQNHNTIYIRDLNAARKLVAKSKKYKIGIKNI